MQAMRAAGGEMNWRSKKLLQAAQGQECQVCIPDICNGNPETVVAAHSNQYAHGKGGQLKAHDIFVAWACSDCHREIDQGHRFSYAEKVHYWQRGFERTLLACVEHGILRVA